MQAEDQIRRTVAVSMAKEAKPDTGAITLPVGPVTGSGLDVPEVKIPPPPLPPPPPQPAPPQPATPQPAPAEPVGDASRAEIKPAPLEVKPAVSAVPSIPESQAIAFHTQARQLMNDGHFEEAVQQFTEALRIDPAMSLAYNGRGYARFRLKQYTEAIADFDQAIKLNPAYENAYLNRGAAKRAAGDKAGGDADMAKAREISAGK